MSIPFTLRRVVQFGDCDPGGILYTPRMSHFIVEAVLDFLGARLGSPAVRRLMALGILPPARALSMEFIRPLAWDDELLIRVSVREIRTSAIVFVLAGSVGGAPAFRAELTQVCVSAETRRPTPVPAVMREALAADIDA